MQTHPDMYKTRTNIKAQTCTQIQRDIHTDNTKTYRKLDTQTQIYSQKCTQIHTQIYTKTYTATYKT